MEDLRLWVDIVQSSKFKSINQLNLLLEPGTQMRRLYDAVAAHKVYADEDVDREIPELSASYNTVKSKLKDRLTDALLLMELNNPEANDRQKAYVECIKKWMTATILFSKNYRQLGIQKLEQLLRSTRRFEFTELTIDVLQALRLHSCVISGNEVQYQEFTNQLEQLELVRHMEERAETAYTGLMIAFINSKSDKREMAERARSAFAVIEPFLTQSDTCRLHIFGRLLQISIYDNLNDYQTVIRLCSDAIAFFERKPYKSISVSQVFYYSLLMSHLNLQDYEHCRLVANQYTGIFQQGSFNWFRWQELYLLAELHAGDYEAAADIWQQVYSVPEYANLPLPISEFWKISEAYLHFLIRCGQLKEKKAHKKFRVSKMLNEVTFAQRDKRGMNIPIMIIQFLLALVEKDYGQCIDRQEGMSKYRSRYLTRENAARSHYFFRMLELIPKCSFRSKEVARKSLPWLQKLKTVPLEAANQNFEVEIIPYETLWGLISELLEHP